MHLSNGKRWLFHHHTLPAPLPLVFRQWLCAGDENHKKREAVPLKCPALSHIPRGTNISSTFPLTSMWCKRHHPFIYVKPENFSLILFTENEQVTNGSGREKSSNAPPLPKRCSSPALQSLCATSPLYPSSVEPSLKKGGSH